MTIKELIEKLKSFDENLEVAVSDNYGGTFDLDDAAFNIETWNTKNGKEFELLDICFG